MTILKTSIEDLANNKKELYILTKGVTKSIQKLTDEELAEPHAVHGYVLYEEENARLETVEVLAIKTDGFVLSTISETFKKEFFAILEVVDDEPFSIRIVKDQTKDGNTFFTCALDI